MSTSHKQNDKHTQEAYHRVVDAFKGDRSKANEFMHQNNRNLRGMSPMEMIGKGQGEALNRAIKDMTRK